MKMRKLIPWLMNTERKTKDVHRKFKICKKNCIQLHLSLGQKKELMIYCILEIDKAIWK